MIRINATPIFVKSFIFIALLICLFSFIKTSLITFNIILLIFLVWLISNNWESVLHSKVNYRGLILVLALALVLFLLRLSVIYNSNIGHLNIPHNDILHYLSISESLNLFGQENIYKFKNGLFPDFHGITPYHYFDLWLNASVVSIFGLKSFMAWELITGPVLLSLLAVGFISLYESQSELGLKGILFSFGFLFYGGLPIEIRSLSIWTINPFLFWKGIVVYLFFILFILFFYSKRRYLAIGSLLTLSWLFPTAAPGIYIGLCFYFAYMLYRRDKSWNYVQIFSLIFVSALSYFIFFKIFGSRGIPQAYQSFLSFETTQVYLAIKSYASQLITIVVRYVLPLCLLFLFDKSLLKRFSTSEKQVLSILLATGVSGLLFSGFFKDSVIASQFGLNILAPGLIIVSFFAFQKVLDSGNEGNYRKAFIILLLIVSTGLSLISNFYSKPSRIEAYSKEYLDAVENHTSFMKNKVGAFVADSVFFTGSILNKNEDYHYPGKYLKVLGSNFFLFNIAPETVAYQIEIESEKHFSDNSTFQVIKKKLNPSLSNDSVRILLMELNQPEFIVATSKSKLPSSLSYFLADSIVDSKSGEKFYLTKYFENEN